jgi:hypothetical protein
MLLQASMLASNSRTILSRYRNQISTFQLGRTTSNYQIAAGDVTASFSPLGSSLGLRGVYGQAKFGGATFSAHGGTIAESWEALFNRGAIDGKPARNTFLRDVMGVKAEYAITQELSAFVTFQEYDDRESSLKQVTDAQGNVTSSALKAAKTQSNTVGAVYRKNALQVTAEVAGSRFSEDSASKKNGNAFVVDGTYQLSTGDTPGVNPINLRFGYHKVKNGFVTLGGAAQPGVEDIYVGSDWNITDWLTWGTEVRGAKQTTPQTSFSPEATRRSEAFTNRFNFNLSKWVQGLNFSLSDNLANNRDSSQANNGKRTQDTWTATTSYSIAGWMLGANLGWGKVESQVNALEDSRMKSIQGTLGRSFVLGEASTGLPPPTMSLNFNLGEQRQRIVNSGTETKTNQLGVNANAQLWGKWTANAAANFGDTTQPNGGPKLKQKSYNFDLAYSFTQQSNLRAYWRRNLMNQGSALLTNKEEVAGLNYNLAF